MLSNLNADDTMLSRPLVECFLDEATFVAERLDDEASAPCLQHLADYTAEQLRKPGDIRLIISLN